MRLSSGKLVVANGGQYPDGFTSEIYDPSNGSWQYTGAMDAYKTYIGISAVGEDMGEIIPQIPSISVLLTKLDFKTFRLKPKMRCLSLEA